MSAHLRFLCPTCQAVMEAPIERAGKKIHCLKCGQRIQIPPPEHAKTILATPLGVQEDPPIDLVSAPEPTFDPVSAPEPIPTAIPSPRFFYLSDGQSLGPLFLEQMQDRIAARQLFAEDLVWQEGTPQWVAAREIPELFANNPEAINLPTAIPAPRFYYLQDGQSVGPLSLLQMQDRIASGQLLAEDLVWKEGTPQWVAAREIPELFAAPPQGDDSYAVFFG